ncbi:hypothetical protein EDB86DRAFT_2901562, partial [Lactarius hatsudake]
AETRTGSFARSHSEQLRSLSVRSPRLTDSSFPFTASPNSVAAVSHPPTAQVARTVAPVPGHSMAAVSRLSSAQVVRTSGTLRSLVSAACALSPTRFACSCCLALHLLRLCITLVTQSDLFSAPLNGSATITTCTRKVRNKAEDLGSSQNGIPNAPRQRVNPWQWLRATCRSPRPRRLSPCPCCLGRDAYCPHSLPSHQQEPLPRRYRQSFWSQSLFPA